MKKRFSPVLMLVSLWSLALTASAAHMNVSVSADSINAGDNVTVSISLDEAINKSEGATMMQGELTYDGAVLEFQSVEKSGQLSNAAKHATENKVQFHYLSMDNSAVDFPAGTLATVTFTAKEDLSEDYVTSDMKFTAYVQDADGKDVGDLTYTDSVSVTVMKKDETPSTETPPTETPPAQTPSTEAPPAETPSTDAVHVHSWNTGMVTKTPTCKETGVKTYTCSCGQTKTETIAKTDTHDYG